MANYASAAWASQATTNAYVVLGSEVFKKRDFRSATIVVQNTGGSNGATIQVQGSLNGTDWADVGSSANIAASGTGVFSITDYWPYLRLQIKAQSSGNQTTVKAQAAAHEA